MIRRLYLLSHGLAVAMSRAAFSLRGFVTLFVASPAFGHAAFHTARAGAVIPLIKLEHCGVGRISTASFEQAWQVRFMELS